MDKPNKIWRTGSKNIAGYKKLGQNYKEKNGSLLGFLEKYGVLVTDEKKTYKLRVDGDRIKLANLQSYDAYQTLRQNLSGYKKVEKELLNLGISKEEVNAFIQDDKQKYKQIQSEVKAADTISSEAVEKGHIGSLKSGYPDVSSNIEPELKRINAAKQGESPFSGALLAEGVPRTSQEAFIRWKDSSGLPDPSDYTYEQRQLLRQAENVDEVDDLIMSFEKGGVRVKRNLSKFGKIGVGLTALGALGDAASATTGIYGAVTKTGEEQTAAGLNAASGVLGLASLAIPPLAGASAAFGAVGMLAENRIERDKRRERDTDIKAGRIQPKRPDPYTTTITKREPSTLEKIASDPLNEFEYFGKQAFSFFGSAVRLASPLGF